MIGDLKGNSLAEFDICSQDACKQGMNIVLDMSRTGYLGPESLGSLIRLESRMRRRREQLWLAELPAHLSRVLRSGQLHKYFMTTTMVSDALYRTAKAEQRLLATFTPPRELERENTAQVDVRVELLQNVCRQIIATENCKELRPKPSALASVVR
jgi:anti-anti-sigma regulatory factor